MNSRAAIKALRHDQRIWSRSNLMAWENHTLVTRSLPAVGIKYWAGITRSSRPLKSDQYRNKILARLGLTKPQVQTLLSH